MNTAVDVNDNELALAIPTSAPWASGQFPFTTAGYDFMAIGYQDPNTGFFAYVEKPYLGFLKDCPNNAQFCNPVDGTFSNPNPAEGADGILGNIPLRIFTTLETSGATLANNITLVTRQDGTVVPVNLLLSGSRGLRMFYIAPPVSWGRSDVHRYLRRGSGLGEGDHHQPDHYHHGAGSVHLHDSDRPDSSTIIPSGPDYVIYGGLGAALNGSNPDALNPFGIQLNVPIDGTTVNTTNITVTDSNNNPISGTVQLNQGAIEFPQASTQTGSAGNHEIIFTPTTPVMLSATTYTITAASLKVDPTVTIPAVAANN